MKCPFCGSDESPLYHICQHPDAPKATCEGLEPNICGAVPPASVPKFDPAMLTPDHLELALMVLGLEFADRQFLKQINLPDVAELAAWSESHRYGHLYPTLRQSYNRLCKPNAIVHDDDGPIMYRWHVVPRNDFAGVYLHVQVRSDSVTRGPHDHEYDSFATMLANMYIDERYERGEYQPESATEDAIQGYLDLADFQPLERGQTMHRKASQLHRVVLPEGVPYCMTLFAHGPRYRKWGFANPDGSWVAAEAVGEIVNGTVMAKGRAAT